MVKLQKTSLQLCQRNETHYWYFSSNLCTSKEPLLQSRWKKEKVPILKMNRYYFTQSIPFFIFSRCNLYIEKIDGQSFRKQRRIVSLTLFAFECE